MKILIAIVCFFGSGFIFAADDAANFHQLLNQIHTLKADFRQDVLDQNGKVLQTAQGQMALQRPGKFRWHIQKPTEQLIITNGERLWIYDPALEQVIIRSLSKASGDAPALLLSNTQDSLEQIFTIKQKKSSNSNLEWFELTPKDKSSVFETIQMGFGNNQIQAMRMQDHLGHITSIQFQNVQEGVVLANTLFVFIPPKKVDIIDETKKTAQ